RGSRLSPRHRGRRRHGADLMNEQSPKKKHTWIWVVLGVFVLLGVLFIGAIAGAVMFFRQNFDVTENISASNATNEFDAVYKRFPGQQPLIQMVEGNPQLVAERVLDNGIGQSVTTLHVLAFDSDDEEMAKV